MSVLVFKLDVGALSAEELHDLRLALHAIPEIDYVRVHPISCEVVSGEAPAPAGDALVLEMSGGSVEVVSSIAGPDDDDE